MSKKTKKNIKVRDLNPKKDAKGGGVAVSGGGAAVSGHPSLSGKGPAPLGGGASVSGKGPSTN